jgi:pimeloyl-ACP methyl ester carboxylesterase
LAVSLPGYGVKEVPPGLDPKITLDVVLDAVSLIKNLPWIDSKRLRLYLYGYSRGAFFAALLANRLEGLEGIVLHSGAYDLNRFYQETPWVRPMLNLSGQQNPKLISILPEIPTRHAPTLVLHGEKDLLVSVQQANLLRDSLEAARKRYDFVLYPNKGHRLPPEDVRKKSTVFPEENPDRPAVLRSVPTDSSQQTGQSVPGQNHPSFSNPACADDVSNGKHGSHCDHRAKKQSG